MRDESPCVEGHGLSIVPGRLNEAHSGFCNEVLLLTSLPIVLIESAPDGGITCEIVRAVAV
jgi:hypothetical protein